MRSVNQPRNKPSKAEQRQDTFSTDDVLGDGYEEAELVLCSAKGGICSTNGGWFGEATSQSQLDGHSKL